MGRDNQVESWGDGHTRQRKRHAWKAPVGTYPEALLLSSAWVECLRRGWWGESGETREAGTLFWEQETLLVYLHMESFTFSFFTL